MARPISIFIMASVRPKSAITPSFNGLTVVMPNGVFPIMRLASEPMAMTRSEAISYATTDGSRLTMPLSLLQTRQLAVPKSMPIQAPSMTGIRHILSKQTAEPNKSRENGTCPKPPCRCGQNHFFRFGGFHSVFLLQTVYAFFMPSANCRTASSGDTSVNETPFFFRRSAVSKRSNKSVSFVTSYIYARFPSSDTRSAPHER